MQISTLEVAQKHFTYPSISFYKIKAPQYVLVSLHLLLQKRHRLSKKYIWTYEGPSIQKKIDTWRSKKKRNENGEEKNKKRKIAMFSKGFTKGERSYKRSSHPPFIIHYTHTRAQLDLIVWLIFLLGSGFWLCNIYDASMPYPSNLPEALHIATIRSRMK
jgi:hypothetical protein